MNHSHARGLFATAALAGATFAQIDVGQPAAPVAVEAQLNCPVPFTNTKDLKGAALLLEYWATW